MKPLFRVPITLLLFPLLIAACHTDSQPASQAPAIQFEAMAVGQKSHYIALLGYDYYSTKDTFVYTDDTLQLEIIAQDNNGYLIEETFQYVGDVSPWFEFEKDSIRRYYVKIRNDTLQFTPVGSPYLESHIFTYQTSQSGLPLADFSSPKIDIHGWKTSLDYCECRRTGYTEDYTLFGEHYDRLNILIANAPMAVDGNGDTYVYSRNKGIVRFSTYSWWFQNGYGWDLLPQQ